MCVEVLSGKVELDETYVDSSRKGVGRGRDAGFGTAVQKVKRGLSRQKVCILSAVDKDGNAFARAYNCGTPSQDNAMELACHLADDSSVTTDDTVAYERLLESNGCFHRVCQDCRDHKAEVNLNRISSFHSMIKEFYRGYRGVATKYINRYAALFSFIWKFRKLKDNDLQEDQSNGRQERLCNQDWRRPDLQAVHTSGHRMGRRKLNVTKSQIWNFEMPRIGLVQKTNMRGSMYCLE